jgi:hypothetical protein
MTNAATTRKQPPLVIGWREYVDLPTLGLTNLKAKIDTGARTSALHAEQISHIRRDEADWVRFHTRFDDEARDIWVECPIHGVRWIKNTSGIPEERIIVRTHFKIADRLWTIDLSLTDRANMTYRMIVGRNALANHGIAVHTRRSHLTNHPAHAQKG